MRRCYERGWITTRDGNCSLRRKKSRILYVTPSGWRKTLIHPEHMIRTRFEEAGVEVPEGARPSGELHMHYLLQVGAVRTRAVLHAHPTYTVAALYRGFDLPALATQFPEIFRYTRVGPSVDPLPATTRALGEATAVALGVDGEGLAYDIVGQHNHGVTAVARDPWSAYEHVERLEHIAQMVLASGVTPEEVARRAALGVMRAAELP
ncbi:MAG: class II aldolase/adducin family protein [Sandaracinaceae bacterium]